MTGRATISLAVICLVLAGCTRGGQVLDLPPPPSPQDQVDGAIVGAAYVLHGEGELLQGPGYQPYTEVVLIPGPNPGGRPTTVEVEGAVAVHAAADGRFVVEGLEPGPWTVCGDPDDEGRPAGCLDVDLPDGASQIQASFGGETDYVSVRCRGDDRAVRPAPDGTCPTD